MRLKLSPHFAQGCRLICGCCSLKCFAIGADEAVRAALHPATLQLRMVWWSPIECFFRPLKSANFSTQPGVWHARVRWPSSWLQSQ